MSRNNRKTASHHSASEDSSTATTRLVAIPKETNAAPDPEPRQKQQTPKTERIGDILHAARVARGDDLFQIAEYLCIKPAFLIALEKSRYDEFPADAYVIGFLRTYANFLGVDGKAAVDRYRYEMAGRRKKPILSMPTPVSEGRAPSGIIMVGATVAVLMIYALWYGFSSSNRAEVNVPPPLPAVAQPVPATAAPIADTNAAAGLTAPVTTTAQAPTASSSVSALALATPTTATPPATASQPAESTAPVIPPASPGIIVTAQAPTATAKDADMFEKIAKDAKADAAAAKESAKTEKEAKDAPNTATKPSDSGPPSRLAIRATQSSWVMVTDDTGKAIFDRVLKPGESYKVPNKPGLLLTTGNGSGIVLSLDGADLPKVAGGAPHVVRNIPLDPDRLTSASENSDR